MKQNVNSCPLNNLPLPPPYHTLPQPLSPPSTNLYSVQFSEPRPSRSAALLGFGGPHQGTSWWCMARLVNSWHLTLKRTNSWPLIYVSCSLQIKSLSWTLQRFGSWLCWVFDRLTWLLSVFLCHQSRLDSVQVSKDFKFLDNFNS